MGKVTPTYCSTRGRAGEIAMWVGAGPLGLPASFRGCIWRTEEKFKAGDDVLVFYRMTKRCRPERKYLAPQWHGPWSMGWKRKRTSNKNMVQFWGISRFQRETDEDQSAIQLALTVFFLLFPARGFVQFSMNRHNFTKQIRQKIGQPLMAESGVGKFQFLRIGIWYTSSRQIVVGNRWFGDSLFTCPVEARFRLSVSFIVPIKNSHNLG